MCELAKSPEGRFKGMTLLHFPSPFFNYSEASEKHEKAYVTPEKTYGKNYSSMEKWLSQARSFSPIVTSVPPRRDG